MVDPTKPESWSKQVEQAVRAGDKQQILELARLERAHEVDIPHEERWASAKWFGRATNLFRGFDEQYEFILVSASYAFSISGVGQDAQMQQVMAQRETGRRALAYSTELTTERLTAMSKTDLPDVTENLQSMGRAAVMQHLGFELLYWAHEDFWSAHRCEPLAPRVADMVKSDIQALMSVGAVASTELGIWSWAVNEAMQNMRHLPDSRDREEWGLLISEMFAEVYPVTAARAKDGRPAIITLEDDNSLLRNIAGAFRHSLTPSTQALHAAPVGRMSGVLQSLGLR